MDIVIRAAVVFAFLWLVIRVGGKREVAQLSAFDMILIVTLGDLVSQGILQEDYSVTGVLLAVATFSVAGMLISWLAQRFPRVRPVMAGTARVVVRDGEPLLHVLAGERMNLDDLHEAARNKGIRSLREVELAALETDGTFSFFTQSGPDQGGTDKPGS